MVDTYRDAKRRGIYPPLFTDLEGDSCFSIYQIRWIKNAVLISSCETFAKGRAIFLSVRKTVNIHGYSELREPIKTHENCYPLIWLILIIITVIHFFNAMQNKCYSRDIPYTYI